MLLLILLNKTKTDHTLIFYYILGSNKITLIVIYQSLVEWNKLVAMTYSKILLKLLQNLIFLNMYWNIFLLFFYLTLKQVMFWSMYFVSNARA